MKASLSAVAQRVIEALEDDDRALAFSILGASPDPSAILGEVIRRGSAAVRGWVPTLANDLLPPAKALPLHLTLLEDADPDNRVSAMVEIERADPLQLSRLVTRLRQRLRSANDDEVLATGWTLAGLHDVASIPILAEVVDQHDPRWWQHKALSSVLIFMTDPAALVAAIKAHDHDRMLWLVHGASLLGTAEAIEALHECSNSAPDETCRRLCQSVIDDLS